MIGSGGGVANSFARTVDLLHRALDAGSVREAVIANNLANADTPGFKRTTVNFESELARALESETRKPALEMARTNPAHLGNATTRDYRDVEIRRVLDWTTASDNNGNNVDAEQEAQRSVENQLLYSLLAQSLAFEFGQVQSVLRS